MPEYSIRDWELKERIEGDLRKRLPPEITWQLQVKIEPFLDSNVTINFKEGRYICTFCISIGILEDQYQPTIDYAMQRIKDHDSKLPLKHRASFHPLVGDQKFMFLFVPEGVAGATDEFVQKLCSQVLPNIPLSKVTWLISYQQGSYEECRNAGVSIIQRWTAAQTYPDDVKFDQKTIKIGSNDVQLTCVIAYLAGGTTWKS